jgi:hypothetical protein
MPACKKSAFGSWRAMASTDLDRRLVHRVCRSTNPYRLEMPLALTDQSLKECWSFEANVSPLGSFGAVRIRGGRVAGVPLPFGGTSGGTT